jgi:hypothetical protein
MNTLPRPFSSLTAANNPIYFPLSLFLKGNRQGHFLIHLLDPSHDGVTEMSKSNVVVGRQQEWIITKFR